MMFRPFTTLLVRGTDEVVKGPCPTSLKTLFDQLLFDQPCHWGFMFSLLGFHVFPFGNLGTPAKVSHHVS